LTPDFALRTSATNK